MTAHARSIPPLAGRVGYRHRVVAGQPTRNFAIAERSISIPRPGPVGTSTQPACCVIGSVKIAIRIGCSD